MGDEVRICDIQTCAQVSFIYSVALLHQQKKALLLMLLKDSPAARLTFQLNEQRNRNKHANHLSEKFLHAFLITLSKLQ